MSSSQCSTPGCPTLGCDGTGHLSGQQLTRSTASESPLAKKNSPKPMKNLVNIQEDEKTDEKVTRRTRMNRTRSLTRVEPGAPGAVRMSAANMPGYSVPKQKKSPASSMVDTSQHSATSLDTRISKSMEPKSARLGRPPRPKVVKLEVVPFVEDTKTLAEDKPTVMDTVRYDTVPPATDGKLPTLKITDVKVTEVKLSVSPEVKPPASPAVKPPASPEVKPPASPEVKPPAVKPPAVKPPTVKSPAVKSPAVKPPAVKPPASPADDSPPTDENPLVIDERPSNRRKQDDPPRPLLPATRRRLEEGFNQTVSLVPILHRINFEQVPDWTINEVADFVSKMTNHTKIAEIFQIQSIDGKALLMLQRADMLTLMKIPLGPTLKIYACIKEIRKRLRIPEQE